MQIQPVNAMLQTSVFDAVCLFSAFSLCTEWHTESFGYCTPHSNSMIALISTDTIEKWYARGCWQQFQQSVRHAAFGQFM